MAQFQTISARCLRVASLLSPSECSELIALGEAAGFERAQVRLADGAKPLPMIRNNSRLELTLPHWRELLWSRLAQAPWPQTDPIDGATPLGLPQSLRFYKYESGERFKMHRDGAWDEAGQRSRATFLIYLNEDFQGGRTLFKDFKAEPKAGDALIFPHREWHEGELVASGVKYALRSDIMFELPKADA